MAGYLGLAQALLNGPEFGRPTEFMMTLIPPIGSNEATQQRSFPWPSELSLGREANYVSTPVPGGTGSIHQWTGTSGQPLSISLNLFRDIRPLDQLPGLVGYLINPQSIENKAFNRDIIRDFEFLDQAILPRYEMINGYQRPVPPYLLMLTFTGLPIFHGGADYILCVLKSLEKQITRTFPSGEPRVATVTLSLEDTIFDQSGKITMHDRKNSMSRTFDT